VRYDMKLKEIVIALEALSILKEIFHFLIVIIIVMLEASRCVLSILFNCFTSCVIYVVRHSAFIH
jgi:hypothetical protein